MNINIELFSFMPSKQKVETKGVAEKGKNQSFVEQLQNYQMMQTPGKKDPVKEESVETNFYEQMIQLLTSEMDDFKLEGLIIEAGENPELEMIFESIKEYLMQQDEFQMIDNDEITEQFIAFFYQLSTLNAEQMEQLDIKNIAKMIQLAQQLPTMEKMHSDLTASDQLKQLQAVLEDTLDYMQQLAKKPHGNTGTKPAIQPMFNQYIKMAEQSNEAPTNQESVKGVMNQQAPVNPFETQSTMSKLEQFTLHFNEAKGETTTNNLQQQFERILARAQFSDASGLSKLSLKLTPEHLGTLKIELIQRDGMLIANLLATSSKAKQLIESQLHLLRQSFINQNVNVERVEINFSQSDEERYTQREQQASEGQSGDGQQSEQKDNHSDTQFKDELNDLLFETEV